MAATEKGKRLQFAIEHGHRNNEIVDLSISSMVMFHSYVNVYQRVHEAAS